jgi:hypothetical protein
MVSLSRTQTNSPVVMMMISRSRSKYKSTCFTSSARECDDVLWPLRETLPGARVRKEH